MITPAARRPTLSVALIARNEADVLAETLASVRSIADEIVVVDTGSTDATIDVAQRGGARIVESPWCDDFSAARNGALTELRGDWVLWLDAGERLAPDSAAEIRDWIDTADRREARYLMIEVPPAKPDGASEQAARLRLVPNLPGPRFEGRIRETLEAGLNASGITPTLSTWRILRGQRDHDAARRIANARRDLLIVERELAERGPQARIYLARADAEAALDRCEAAIDSYRLALEHAAPESPELLEAYYGLIAVWPRFTNDRESLLGVCVKALEAFPFDAQLLCFLAGTLLGLGRSEIAARAYDAAFRFGQNQPTLWHARELFEIVACCLAAVQQLLNDDDKARAVLEETLAERPRAFKARRQLLDLHVKHERTKEALAQVPHLVADPASADLFRAAVRGSVQAARANWISALAYLQTAFRGGCRDPLCLRWLSVSLIATEQTVTAAEVLEAWRELDPANPELRKYLAAIQPAVDEPRADEAAAEEARRFRIDERIEFIEPTPPSAKVVSAVDRSVT